MSTRDSIVDAWFLKAIEVYPEVTRHAMMRSEDRFRNPVASSLRESLTILVRELAGDMRPGPVSSALDAIVRVRAVQDCTPEQAIAFAEQLRESIRTCKSDALFPDLEQRIDSLIIAARQQYALCRGDVARIRSRQASPLQARQPWMRRSL